MILSVCYGRDPLGKVRMNFGPINQSGGERRLNVAFSRAKRHMMVVSSMRGADITNDFNDGASCLKRYLRYAEAVSRGENDLARRVLDELAPARRKEAFLAETAVQQLAEGLRGRGYEVDLDVGTSRFRCRLAVRRPGELEYRLAVFLDTRRHFAETDILGRDVLKPALLRSFGWRSEFVLAREWLLEPEAVLSRLEARLAGEEPDLATAPAPPAEPERESEAVSEQVPVPVPEPSPEPAGLAPDVANMDTATDSVGAPVGTSFQRYLEFVGGGSSKFWEIRVLGCENVVRFGRIGTAGQERAVRHSTPEAAEAEARKLAESKTRKGYVVAVRGASG